MQGRGVRVGNVVMLVARVQFFLGQDERRKILDFTIIQFYGEYITVFPVPVAKKKKKKKTRTPKSPSSLLTALEPLS
jgi:hypothetical protein